MKYLHPNEIFESPLAEIYTEVFGEQETEQFLGAIWNKLKKHGKPIMLGLGLLARDPAGNLKPIDPYAEKRRRDAMVEQANKPASSPSTGPANEHEYEDEYTLKKNVNPYLFKNYLGNLRAQARRIGRNANSGVNISGMQVHHRLPLQYAPDMVSNNAKYKMNNFAHPNSPGNLLVVDEKSHALIHKEWKKITSSENFKRAWNQSANDPAARKNLIRSVRQRVDGLIKRLRVHPVKMRNMKLTNKEMELSFMY